MRGKTRDLALRLRIFHFSCFSQKIFDIVGRQIASGEQVCDYPTGITSINPTKRTKITPPRKPANRIPGPLWGSRKSYNDDCLQSLFCPLNRRDITPSHSKTFIHALTGLSISAPELFDSEEDDDEPEPGEQRAEQHGRHAEEHEGGIGEPCFRTIQPATQIPGFVGLQVALAIEKQNLGKAKLFGDLSSNAIIFFFIIIQY